MLLATRLRAGLSLTARPPRRQDSFDSPRKGPCLRAGPYAFLEAPSEVRKSPSATDVFLGG